MFLFVFLLISWPSVSEVVSCNEHIGQRKVPCCSTCFHLGVEVSIFSSLADIGLL